MLVGMAFEAADGLERAIARNRAALLRVVALLFLMAGLDEGGADTVPRRVWRQALRLLRPAESAARRLIVVAARGIEVEAPKPRAARRPTSTERLQAKGLLVVHEGINLGLARAWSEPPAAVPEKSAPRIPAFALTDPSRRFDKRGWDGLRPFPKHGFDLADPDEAVNAAPLCRRVLALKAALDDLPRHATRLARREARANLASSQMQGGFAPASPGQRLAAHDKESQQLKGATFTPIRLGHPPGRRRKPSREVDHILIECHELAVALRRQSASPP